MAKEVEQKDVDVLLVKTVGGEDMFKGIVGSCIIDSHNMHMQLLLKRQLIQQHRLRILRNQN